MGERKVRDFGSSIVDILVYHETIVRGRRVFMDFRHNPSSAGNAKLGEFAFDDLDPEVHTYLKNSHALLSTPIERLMKMNPPAIDLYREHGIDITKEPLEVAVCAQHNNGGLKGNLWWESDLKHLFPVGEVNGSHGVYRPGGSALNSGQCGSLRAAQFISKRYTQTAPDATTFAGTVAGQVTAKMEMINGVMAGQPRLQTPQPCHPCADSACTCVPSAAMSASTPAAAALVEYRQTLQRRMSSAGAHLRKLATVKEALTQARQQLAQWSKCKADDPAQLPYALKNRDAIIAQIVYLAAMEEYLAKGGVSRGSYMVLDTAGELPCAGLGDEFRFALGEDDLKDKVLEASYNAASTSVTTAWTPRRPVPPDEGWYENVWADFREDRIVRE